MTEKSDLREKEIIKIARGYLSKPEDFPSDAQIDAAFLFRYGAGWCEWINSIRGMIASLLESESFEELTLNERVLVDLHLDTNAGLEIKMTFAKNIRTGYAYKTAKCGYSILDEEIRDRFSLKNYRIAIENDPKESELIERLIWQEANQTLKIQKEIRRIIRTYQLVPSKNEFGKFPSKIIEKQYGAVVGWILYGGSVPSFLYKKTRLVENKRGTEIKRIIRLYKMGENQNRVKTSQLRKETRIRTWVIYLITNRGGGRKTEQLAVDTWNQEFNGTLNRRNFIAERSRLFSHGSKMG